jgi:hypothetical protein
MKKLVLIPAFLVMLSAVVSADYGMMGDYGAYGMMGAGGVGMGLLGLLWLVIGAFIFSVIFWSTYNWLVKEKKRRAR